MTHMPILLLVDQFVDINCFSIQIGYHVQKNELCESLFHNFTFLTVRSDWLLMAYQRSFQQSDHMLLSCNRPPIWNIQRTTTCLTVCTVGSLVTPVEVKLFHDYTIIPHDKVSRENTKVHRQNFITCNIH